MRRKQGGWQRAQMPSEDKRAATTRRKASKTPNISKSND